MELVQDRNHSPKIRLSRFSRNLLEEWRRLSLPLKEATFVVAVSGGADSCALLLSLDELIKAQKLNPKLIVAHLDHGLRKGSGEDAKWVKALAKSLGHDFALSRVDLTKRKTNLEQAARNSRYSFLHRTATRKKSEYVLTAHTLDDQAETILLRLLRGSAAEGLTGTPAIRTIQPRSQVKLVRPLLTWARRKATEAYCLANGIQFRDDEMNEDETFARVKVRRQLLPLMKSFNSRIVETLGRTAGLLSEDASALNDQAEKLLALATETPSKTGTKRPYLNVKMLMDAPSAVRSRVLREWILRARGDLRRVERVHLLAVEKLIAGAVGGKMAELPGGMVVTKKRGMLELSGKKRLKKGSATSKIPGSNTAGN